MISSVAAIISGPMPSPWATVMGVFVIVFLVSLYRPPPPSAFYQHHFRKRRKSYGSPSLLQRCNDALASLPSATSATMLPHLRSRVSRCHPRFAQQRCKEVPHAPPGESLDPFSASGFVLLHERGGGRGTCWYDLYFNDVSVNSIVYRWKMSWVIDSC